MPRRIGSNGDPNRVHLARTSGVTVLSRRIAGEVPQIELRPVQREPVGDAISAIAPKQRTLVLRDHLDPVR